MSGLTFETVPFDKLVNNQKYLIIPDINNGTNTYEYTNEKKIGIFILYRTIYYTGESTDIAAQFIETGFCNGNIAIYDRNQYTYYFKKSNRNYLKLNPKKKLIQQAMEQRALNIILRVIIGDNTFTY